MVSGVRGSASDAVGGRFGKTKYLVMALVAVPLIVFVAGVVARWVDDHRQFGGKTNSSSPLSKYVIRAEEEALAAAAAPQCRAEACTFTISPTGLAATSTNETLSAQAALVLPTPQDYRAAAGAFFTNLRTPAQAPDLELPLGNSSGGQAFTLMTEHGASGTKSDITVTEQGLITAAARSSSPDQIEDWQPARFSERNPVNNQFRIISIERNAQYARITWQPVPVALRVRLANSRLAKLQIGDRALVFFNPADAQIVDMRNASPSSALLCDVSAIEAVVGTNESTVLLQPVGGDGYRGTLPNWLAERAWHSRNQQLPQVLPERVHVTAWRVGSSASAADVPGGQQLRDIVRRPALALPKTAVSSNCAKPAKTAIATHASKLADPAAACVWLLQGDFAVPVQVSVLQAEGETVVVAERVVFAGLAVADVDWQALSRAQRRQLSRGNLLTAQAKIISTPTANLVTGMAARARELAPASSPTSAPNPASR